MPIRILMLLLAGYALVCVLVFVFQERLLFLPREQQVHPVGAHVQPVEVPRPGATLRGWLVNAGSDGPLLVYFGGNAEELSGLVDILARLDATTALVNYRGFGPSGGRPAVAALLADAEAVVASMIARTGPERPLILFGRSIGSGIAAHATRTAAADGLILMSPYRSLGILARRQVPWLPVRWLLRDDIDAVAALDSLPPRVLVLHGREDMIIPPEESLALAARIERPEVVAFDGNHNLPVTDPQIWPHLVAFIRAVAATIR